jgi:plastocyanin
MSVWTGGIHAIIAVLASLPPLSDAGAKVLRVRIADMAFEPAVLSATRGDTIEWRNDDFIDHTATAGGGGFDLTIRAGQAASVTVGTAGSFSYSCRFHPQMTGTVIVK